MYNSQIRSENSFWSSAWSSEPLMTLYLVLTLYWTGWCLPGPDWLHNVYLLKNVNIPHYNLPANWQTVSANTSHTEAIYKAFRTWSNINWKISNYLPHIKCLIQYIKLVQSYSEFIDYKLMIGNNMQDSASVVYAIIEISDSGCWVSGLLVCLTRMS